MKVVIEDDDDELESKMPKTSMEKSERPTVEEDKE
jgi:hypothetical protein